MNKARLILNRFIDATGGKAGDGASLTIGVLRLISPEGDATEIFTGELPWRGNKRSVSRIPAGDYALKHETQGRWVQPLRERFGYDFVIEIIGVKGRSQIQIHPGNFADDIEGCILPGNGARIRKAPPMVSDSNRAYQRFMGEYNRLNKAGQAPMRITITDPPTTPKGKQ